MDKCTAYAKGEGHGESWGLALVFVTALWVLRFEPRDPVETRDTRWWPASVPAGHGWQHGDAGGTALGDAQRARSANPFGSPPGACILRENAQETVREKEGTSRRRRAPVRR